MASISSMNEYARKRLESGERVVPESTNETASLTDGSAGIEDGAQRAVTTDDAPTGVIERVRNQDNDVTGSSDGASSLSDAADSDAPETIGAPDGDQSSDASLAPEPVAEPAPAMPSAGDENDNPDIAVTDDGEVIDDTDGGDDDFFEGDESDELIDEDEDSELIDEPEGTFWSRLETWKKGALIGGGTLASIAIFGLLGGFGGGSEEVGNADGSQATIAAPETLSPDEIAARNTSTLTRASSTASRPTLERNTEPSTTRTEPSLAPTSYGVASAAPAPAPTAAQPQEPAPAPAPAPQRNAPAPQPQQQSQPAQRQQPARVAQQSRPIQQPQPAQRQQEKPQPTQARKPARDSASRAQVTVTQDSKDKPVVTVYQTPDR